MFPVGVCTRERLRCKPKLDSRLYSGAASGPVWFTHCLQSRIQRNRAVHCALFEAYGYPTIEADANAFSQLTGLPPLTSSNFSIVYPQGPPLRVRSRACCQGGILRLRSMFSRLAAAPRRAPKSL